ncbi:MAG: cupredoxin domain-containing protein [Myxococcota bacterium]
MGARFFLLALAALLLVPASGWADEIMIHVMHGKLDPARIEISAGDTVVFHNLDEMPGGHTIVAHDGSFESPPLAKDQQWRYRFDKSGTYSFRIKQHPAAVGTIVVEEED